MIVDVGHPAFACNDISKTLAFYEILGIKESFRLNKEDGSLWLVYLHVGGDRFIEVFPDGPEVVPGRPQSFMHLCLKVENIEAFVEKIRAAGVHIDSEVMLGADHNKQAWIKDPDLNPIELMELSYNSPQAMIARGETPKI